MARGKRTDLAGRRFGNLVVLDNSQRWGSKDVRWLCRCDCGTEVWKNAKNLLIGRIKSCGTDHRYDWREQKHG